MWNPGDREQEGRMKTDGQRENEAGKHTDLAVPYIPVKALSLEEVKLKTEMERLKELKYG